MAGLSRGTSFGPVDPETKPGHERRESAQASSSTARAPPRRVLGGPQAGGRSSNGWAPPRSATGSSPDASKKSGPRMSLSSTTSKNAHASSPTLVFGRPSDKADARRPSAASPSISRKPPAFGPNAWKGDNGLPKKSAAVKSPPPAAATQTKLSPNTNKRTAKSMPALEEVESEESQEQARRKTLKGKAKAQVVDLTNDDDDSSTRARAPTPGLLRSEGHDSIVNNSDVSEDEMNIVAAPPAKFDFTSKRNKPSAPASSPKTTRPSQAADQSELSFDSPWRGVESKQKVTAKLKPRTASKAAALLPLALGFDKSSTDDVGLGSSTRKEPSPAEGKKQKSPSIVELPIHLYALGHEFAFPVAHRHQQHRLLVTGSTKKRTLVLERRESARWEQLVEFGHAQLNGIVRCSDPNSFIQFKFKRIQKEPAKIFGRLFQSAPLPLESWNNLHNDQRLLTVVMTDKGDPDAFAQLLELMSAWRAVDSSKFGERVHTGTGSEVEKAQFLRALDEVAEIAPTVARPEPPSPPPAPGGECSTERRTLFDKDKQIARDALNQPAEANHFYSYTDLPSARLRRAPKTDYTEHGSDKDEPPPKPPKAPKKRDPVPLETLRLVWPYGNGLHVTHGDIKRLEPEEFLNDTLIELGLKMILDKYNKSRGVGLSPDVHVFNAFFYKLLAQRKPKEHLADWDPHSLVRKWTAKFDLFDRKFVIIPINENLHWFLAVIVNPGAVAKEGPPPSPEPEPVKTRSHRLPAEEPPERNPELEAELFTSEESKPDEAAPVPSAAPEDAVERGSLVGGGPGTDPLFPPAATDSASSAPAAVDKEEEAVPMEGVEQTDPPVPTSHAPLAVSGPSSSLPLLTSSQPPSSQPPPPSPKPRVPIPFSHSAVPPGEKPGETQTEAVTDGVDQLKLGNAPDDAPATEEPKVEPMPESSPVPFDPNKCYIYTFDSLQSSHRSTTNKLTKYLVSEARDKKHIIHPDVRAVVPLEVIVPQQDNLSDCGLYVLHYVEKLLLEWDSIRDFIHSPLGHAQPGKGKGKYATDEVDKAWDQASALGCRDKFQKEVTEKANKWKDEEWPRVQEEERLAHEKEAKRREERKKKEAKAEEEAKARGGDQPHADSSIDLEVDPHQLLAQVDAEDKSLEADQALAAAPEADGGTTVKAPPTQTSTLRVPKNASESKKAAGRSKKDLGTMTLSDSSDDDSSDDSASNAEDAAPARDQHSPERKLAERSPTPAGQSVTVAGLSQTDSVQIIASRERTPSADGRSPPPKKRRPASAKKPRASLSLQPPINLNNPASAVIKLTDVNAGDIQTTTVSDSSDSGAEVAEGLHPGSSMSPQQRRVDNRPDPVAIPVNATKAFPALGEEPPSVKRPAANENDDLQVMGTRSEAQAAAARSAERRAHEESGNEMRASKRLRKASEKAAQAQEKKEGENPSEVLDLE